eukprot:scaffold117869_cov63-Phaeocystis_antarctica.AAC.1
MCATSWLKRDSAVRSRSSFSSCAAWLRPPARACACVSCHWCAICTWRRRGRGSGRSWGRAGVGLVVRMGVGDDRAGAE